jgi:hypothetical protein
MFKPPKFTLRWWLVPFQVWLLVRDGSGLIATILFGFGYRCLNDLSGGHGTQLIELENIHFPFLSFLTADALHDLNTFIVKEYPEEKWCLQLAMVKVGPSIPSSMAGSRRGSMIARCRLSSSSAMLILSVEGKQLNRAPDRPRARKFVRVSQRLFQGHNLTRPKMAAGW